MPFGMQWKSAILWSFQGWGVVLLLFLSFFPTLFHLEEYIFFGLLTLALGTAWVDGGKMWIRTPIDFPLVCFLSWVLFSIPFALDSAYSFEEWRKLAASVLAFYWVLLVLKNQPNRFIYSAILGAVVVGILVQCSYALIEFLEQGGTWKHRGIRATAPSSGFQELTTYMVVTIPLLVFSLIYFRRWWQRVLSYSAITLAFLAQILNYTRAGWLGMLAQAVGFGVFTRRPSIRILLVVGFIMGCLGLLLLSQLGYHKETFDPLTLNVRLAVWELGFQEMLKQPILGLGFGINTFQPLIEGIPPSQGRMHLHNTFLMVGVGSGWPALIFLLWFFIGSFLALVNRASREPDSLQFGIMVATAIMILGFVVRNLFDIMFKGSIAYLFWILLATGFACFQWRPGRSQG